MRIFISAGEPSGDLHGANLIRAVAARLPNVEWFGFGGERMTAAGCRLIHPLAHHAVMFLGGALAQVPFFLKLLSKTDRLFRHQRPDAVVLIDYPGFHWWVARRAHFHGIPVFYFVPPQLWAWAGWRVRKIRRFVDHVLCTLPLEKDWYRERGVDSVYIGHPYFDELAAQKTDSGFLSAQRKRGGRIIGLLPGSRDQEVKRNLSTLVRSSARIHAACPDTRFLVACFNLSQRQTIDQYLDGRGLPIETFTGRTPEIIQIAHSCIAVSGSVGLELLYHETPSVIVYRVSRLTKRIFRPLVTTKYMSLVNVLAGDEFMPEFPSDQCEAESVSAHVIEWLNHPAIHERKRTQLAGLRRQVAKPGACAHAADYILSALGAPILAAKIPA
jgi:lipid-A-disaccharide synthase